MTLREGPEAHSTTGGVVTSCLAPSMNLYFFPDGQVRTCCRNAEPLGWIGRHRLGDIWRGNERGELVRAMSQGSFPGGCAGCGEEVSVEGRAAAYPATFDRFAEVPIDPTWPQRMEFNLSNVCNLQCVQCNGELSSSIRHHRERRPRLVSPYDDEFFDDLRAFIPHLRKAQFAGGEPFLASESYRVWEMIFELNPEMPCWVVTNATQWNNRVVEAITRLKMGFAFSLDAVSKELYESIRVGASFDKVMRNIERFREVASDQGTSTSVNFCLMSQNYRGFGDLLLYAEERGMKVDVSVVRDPPSSSLASLGRDELSAVHAYLTEETAKVLPFLNLNASIWSSEVERVGSWLEAAPEQLQAAREQWEQSRPTKATLRTKILEFPVRGTSAHDDQSVRARMSALPNSVLHDFTVDRRDTVVEISSSLPAFLGVAAVELIGRPASVLQEAAIGSYGEIEDYVILRADDDQLEARATFASFAVEIAMVALRDADGVAEQARILFTAPLDAAEPSAGAGHPA